MSIHDKKLYRFFITRDTHHRVQMITQKKRKKNMTVFNAAETKRKIQKLLYFKMT